jgi:peptidoglycan/LPS O-acetylase OafA/YrhL
MLALHSVGAIDARPDAERVDASRLKSLPQIPALTGLRFFAAFSILFEHAADWLAQFQDSNIRQQFIFVGMYGMPLFFVLSGFVIHYNYANLFMSRGITRAACEFAAARFARLFPLYFFLLLIALFADDFVAKVYNRPDLFFAILGYYVTLTQSWWYIVYEKQSIIYWLFSLSWSISTEMFFYAAYVAVVFVVLLLRGARAAVISATGFAVAITLMFIVSRYYLSEILSMAQRHALDYTDIGTAFEHSFYRWLFYFSPYTRVFEFFLGCLTAHAFVLLRPRPVSSYEQQFANLLLVVALAGLAFFGALYQGAIKFGPLNGYVQHLALNFLCAPAIAFIMFYVGRYDTSFTRFLSLPTFVALGDMSYSIYLVHTWTLRIFFHPAPAFSWIWGLDAVFRVLFGIVLTLLVAYATYHLVEVPSRVWLRRKLGRLIAVGFGDAAGSPRLVATTNLAADFASRSGSTPRTRLVFSVAATSLLASIAVIGETARSDAVWNKLHRLWFGNQPEIGIVSATYGLSCQDYLEPAPFSNSVAPGNATNYVKRACDARQRCDLRVDAARMGDPANSCAKDFSVEYRCTGSEALKSAFLPPEAQGKRLILDCAAAK